MTYQRIKFISVPIYYQNGEFYFVRRACKMYEKSAYIAAERKTAAD